MRQRQRATHRSIGLRHEVRAPTLTCYGGPFPAHPDARRYAKNDARVVKIARVLSSLAEADPSKRKREELYLMARMARKARRFEDMVMIINELMTTYCLPADSSSCAVPPAHEASAPTWKETRLLDRAYEGIIRELMKEWRSASCIVLDDELDRERHKGQSGRMNGDDEDEEYDEEKRRKKEEDDEDGRYRREKQVMEAKERQIHQEGKIREAVKNLISTVDAIMERCTTLGWFNEEMKLLHMKTYVVPPLISIAHGQGAWIDLLLVQASRSSDGSGDDNSY